MARLKGRNVEGMSERAGGVGRTGMMDGMMGSVVVSESRCGEMKRMKTEEGGGGIDDGRLIKGRARLAIGFGRLCIQPADGSRRFQLSGGGRRRVLCKLCDLRTLQR